MLASRSLSWKESKIFMRGRVDWIDRDQRSRIVIEKKERDG